jgi:hypothetical protein
MSFEKEKQEVKKSEGYDRGSKVKEVKNAALSEATLKAKPNPWTKRMFMVRSIFSYHAESSTKTCSSSITVCS